ncbi:TetR/AcrR family transcriptional regulator [Acinetobacter proteolyticus]|uniref:TetR/AcrR family transcriptional regulator n=1 Tax=Acinetobacter proteolyticus TaxID=1776741 RepID=UPI003D960037
MGALIKHKNRRELLILAAVELLEQEGPNAMTVRRITAKIGGTSIMIYREFGSITNLASTVVDYGFQLLAKELQALPKTSDVLVDLWLSFCIVREFSLFHKNLYAVMFAVQNIGGHKRSGEELDLGRDTLKIIHDLCKKAVKEGVFTTNAWHATQFFWTMTHGRLMFEMAGYLSKDKHALESYSQLIITSMIGLGAKIELVNEAIQIN